MNKGITKAMILSNSGKNKGSREKENNQDYGRDYDRMDRDYGSRDYNRMGRNSSGYDDDRMGGGYGRREYDDHDMSQYGNMGRRYGREAKDYMTTARRAATAWDGAERQVHAMRTMMTRTEAHIGFGWTASWIWAKLARLTN